MEQFTQTGENGFFHFPLNQPPTNRQADSDLFAVLNRNTKRKKNQMLSSQRMWLLTSRLVNTFQTRKENGKDSSNPLNTLKIEKLKPSILYEKIDLIFIFTW